MKKTALLFLTLFSLHFAYGQQVRNEILLPEIDGYELLKCDFHLHTVFSDGTVWPVFRVGEAWMEGLDVIAITDHLEYTPKKDYIPVNHNAPYEIAEKAAANVGILLIKGTEITKSMPPGHFNALFVKDAAKISNQDYKTALREAKNQGAYVLWNHPGWKAQTPNGPQWLPEHQELFDEKLFQGVEVANHNEWYPEVLDWAKDKNLTVFSNSDAHDPIATFLQIENMRRRPITLVISKSRSQEDIREALDARRTIGWFGDLLLGNANWLEVVAKGSLTARLITKGEKNYALQLTNVTDLTFELEFPAKSGSTAKLPPLSSVMVQMTGSPNQLEVTIKNFLAESKSPLKITLPVK